MLRAGRAAIDDAYRVGYLSEGVAHDLKGDVDSRLVLGAENGWSSVWSLAAEGAESEARESPREETDT